MTMSITGILAALVISIFLHHMLIVSTTAAAAVSPPHQHYHPGPHHQYRPGRHHYHFHPRPRHHRHKFPILRNRINAIPKPKVQLPSEAREYIAAHNLFRNKVNMPPLQWDQSLAKYAKSWGEKRINDCSQHTHSKGPHGENMLWEQYDELNPDGVVQVWFDEQQNYDHHNLRCKCSPDDANCMCGHYTQLVWSTTQRVGCSNVTCNDDKGLLVVCSYEPAGNHPLVNPLGRGGHV